jgi:endothelin-converting enzyme/putative endopeptidase
MTVADLQKCTSVDWKNYFTKVGYTNVDSLIVSQPKYMTYLETMLKRIK